MSLLNKSSKLKIIIFLLFFMMVMPLLIKADNQGEGQLVYVIPVEQEVEKGLYAFLKRSINEAEEAGANHIVFEIDSPGGLVDSANNIGTLLQGLDIPYSAFIINQALSAGSYIALHSNSIYMKPNATMGSSAIITGDGTAADKKSQSAWLAAMKGVAEANDRDPIYAMAMADESIDLPELDAGKGDLLTLTANEALQVGYAEGIVNNQIELLYELGLSEAVIVETEISFAESVARFLTHPVVIPILLSIASLGLILELYSPGFGVPGSMGLIALALFFYGHIIAGLAGMEAIVLLIIGILLIIIEMFVSGGILGILGLGAVVASLFLSGYNFYHMALSISIAVLVAIIASIILFRRIGAEKGIFNKLILRDRTTTELGYVTIDDRQNLVGKEGVAATTLRPSGTGVFDNERLDIVSEGDYIEKGASIVIVQVESMRVVVRKNK